MSLEQRIRACDIKAHPLLQAAAKGDAELHEREDIGTCCVIATATNIASQSYFNKSFETVESLIRAASGEWSDEDGRTVGFPVDEKNQMWVYTAGPIEGADWNGEHSKGAARRADNAAGFYIACIDLDMGHASLEQAHARLAELGWLGGVCATYGCKRALSAKRLADCSVGELVVNWRKHCRAFIVYELDPSTLPFLKTIDHDGTRNAAKALMREYFTVAMPALGEIDLALGTSLEIAETKPLERAYGAVNAFVHD